MTTNPMQRAMQMLDVEASVEAAIHNWMRVMDVDRVEAARRVLADALGMTNSLGEPDVNPDLVAAARKAYKKATRS